MHKRNYNKICIYKTGKNLNTLLQEPNKTELEKKLIINFYKYSPLLRNKCILNILTYYIEDAEMEDKWKKDHPKFDYHVLLSNEDFKPQKSILKRIKAILLDFHKSYDIISKNNTILQNEFGEEYEYENYYDYLMDEAERLLLNEVSNEKELVDYVIYIYYNDMTSRTKILLWRTFGDILLDNIKSKSNKCYIPVECDSGFNYLGKQCIIKEVDKVEL